MGDLGGGSQWTTMNSSIQFRPRRSSQRCTKYTSDDGNTEKKHTQFVNIRKPAGRSREQESTTSRSGLPVSLLPCSTLSPPPRFENRVETENNAIYRRISHK